MTMAFTTLARTEVTIPFIRPDGAFKAHFQYQGDCPSLLGEYDEVEHTVYTLIIDQQDALTNEYVTIYYHENHIGEWDLLKLWEQAVIALNGQKERAQ